MSNIIDNLLLNETTTNQSNIVSVIEQTSKNKPSLFDSLLTNISSTEETKIDNSNTSLKIQAQTTDIKDIKIETNNLLNNVQLLENVESTEIKEGLENLKISTQITDKEKAVSVGSLLDKLVIEAKNSVSMEQPTKDKPSLFDSLLTNISSNQGIEQTDKKVSPKTEIKETDFLNSKTVNDVLISNNEIVDSQNSNLIDDTKSVVSSKNNILVEPIKSTEVNLKTIAQNTLNENINLDISIQNQEVAINQIVANADLTKLNKNVIKKEEAGIETVSLLDKLVLNVKKNNKELVNNIIIDSNNPLAIENSLLDEKLISSDINVSKIENIVSEDIKAEDSKILNDISQNQEVINTIINTHPEVKDKVVVLEKDKVEVLDTNLDNKIINIAMSDLGTTNISMKEKIIDKINNLVDLKSENEFVGSSDTLASTSIDEIAITDKNNTEVKSEIKKDEKLSLLDQLIQKNSEKFTVLDTIDDNTIDSSTKEIITKDLISSIYLGSQKNKVNNQTLFNKNEALSILKEGNSIQAVKTSAEILDLGLEDMALDENINIDELDLKQLNRKDFIENLLLQKNIKTGEIRNLITKSVEASNALLENTLTIVSDTTVNVNSPIAYNIQSKIIGAKQQMSAMMSDISRQMYENYKPPVTAFKINLNPTELGSIAILMKSDKNSGLSITMNVSNNVTLDTLIENQNVLKNSLNKTFDENTKFNLDFGSSNQNSNQSSNNQNQNTNRQFEQQMATETVLQLKEENKDIEEKIIDYM